MPEASSQGPSSKTRPYLPRPIVGWMIWLLAALFYAYEFIHRVATNTMIPDIMEDFGVSAVAVGHFSAIYFYAYALIQVPAGMLYDKYVTKRILAVACGLVVIGSFILYWAPVIGWAYFARLLIGAGSAFAFVGCLKLGGCWLSASAFPLVVGLTNLFGMIGAILGGKPLAILVNWVDWRPACLILGIIGALLFFLICFCIPKPCPELALKHTSSSVKPSDHGRSVLDALKLILKDKRTWLISLYGCLLVAPIAAFAELWGAEFLKQVHSIPKANAAFLTSMIFVGIAIGSIGIGWLASRTPHYIRIMRLATTTGLLCLLGILFWEGLSTFSLLFILLTYGICTSNMLLCFTLIRKQHPDWASSTALGFTNMLIMAGAAVTQPMIGWFLDQAMVASQIHQGTISFETKDFQMALVILPICLFLALALTLTLKKGHKEDTPFS